MKKWMVPFETIIRVVKNKGEMQVQSSSKDASWVGYVAALLITGVSFIAVLGVAKFTTPNTAIELPYLAIVLMLTVMVAEYTFGTGPALLTLFIGVCAHFGLFIGAQTNKWNLLSTNGVAASLAAFTVGSIIGGTASHFLRFYRDQNQMLTLSLEAKVRERTAQLEALNRELEAFVYSVSHDLQGPLMSMVGFGQALLEDYGDKFDDTARNYLVRCISEAKRMDQIVDDLLRLSRVARAELLRENVNLSKLAESIIAQLAESEPNRNVSFHAHPNLVAHVDPGLIKIVFENLLGNAWKFTGHRDNAEIEFGAFSNQSERVFFVRDNGAGFDITKADKLFAPFQRLHKESEFPGTGIGLAIVQRIISRHGGRIWAEGEVDKGAIFYFTLS